MISTWVGFLFVFFCFFFFNVYGPVHIVVIPIQLYYYSPQDLIWDNELTGTKVLATLHELEQGLLTVK